MAHDDTHGPTHAQPLPQQGQEGPRRSRLRIWLLSLQAALARAERHITENFRVPPHGG